MRARTPATRRPETEAAEVDETEGQVPLPPPVTVASVQVAPDWLKAMVHEQVKSVGTQAEVVLAAPHEHVVPETLQLAALGAFMVHHLQSAPVHVAEVWYPLQVDPPRVVI